MKEKILAKLKTACGKTTATTEITLNKWVDYLSAKITEEDQIDAEVEIIKPLLDTYEGNMNFVAAEAAKKAKAAAPSNPPKLPTEPIFGEPEWFTTYKQQQMADTAELKTKLTTFEKQKQQEQMVSEARAAIKSKYKISSSEMALSEKSLDLALRVGNFEKTEDLISGWKTQFEDLRQTLGLSGVEPIDSNSGGSGASKEKPIIEALKKSLQKEGKLTAAS